VAARLQALRSVLLPLTVFSLLCWATDPNVRLIDEIVAKVNNEIITRTEMERLGTQAQADALRAKIDQLLLIQKAKDLNVKVDGEVTRWLAEIQVKSGISDPDKFREWVREQAGGIPYEDVRQNKMDLLMTQRVIGQEVGAKIVVPQSEIQKYYDDHKADFVRQEMVFLREILIATADEKKAKEIALRAQHGEKFSALARDYSAAESARNDGELGSFQRGELKKEIEERVFGRDKGYVTEAFRTENGYLILKVEERYAAGQASLEDVKNEVMEKLYTPRLDPALRVYLTKLREDAFLEIKPGYVDSGAAPNKDTSWKDPATLKPDTTTKEEVAARRRKRKLLGVI
jgi:peptidyl-prolyl cis-trans isomerase SurA